LVAQFKDLKAKRSREAATLGLIQRGVDDPIFPRIMRITNAKQAWKTLQSEYEGDVNVGVINLQSLGGESENIKMEENDIVDEFSNMIVKVINQIKSYDEEISDRRFVVKILISFLEKFNPIMMVIEETKDL